MAEQDDLEFGYSNPRRGPAQGLDHGLFEDEPSNLDDYLDDYSSESANDDYLEDFDEDSFVSDGYDDFGDSFIDDDDLEYLSTPPGAFYKACARQLRHGPRFDEDSGDQGSTGSRPGMTQDRGPSYML